MKNQAYFVPSMLTFIPLEWAHDGTYPDDKWPSDAVLLSEEETAEYWLVAPPAGKKLGVLSGKPAWVDIPPPSRSELITNSERARQRLLIHADKITSDWRTELALDEISSDDREKLSAWMAYKREVKSVSADDAITAGFKWPLPPAE